MSRTLAKPRIRPTIRYLELRHMPQVNSLEQMQEEEIPLPQKEIHELLRNQCQQHISVVAEVEGRVDGYLIYGWQDDNVILRRVVIHPDDRYGDVERALFQWVCRLLGVPGQRVIFLVREKDLGRQILLSSLGFRGVRVLRGYFLESGEDAYEMVYTAGEMQ